MGLPYKEDNAEGYDRARLSTKYNEFANKTYLLVHGSLDDNVHYQQSMSLTRSLELHDIPFEQIVSAAIGLFLIYSRFNQFYSFILQTYPDEDHSLWGVRRHLYHALDRFFAKCLTTNSTSSSK